MSADVLLLPTIAVEFILKKGTCVITKYFTLVMRSIPFLTHSVIDKNVFLALIQSNLYTPTCLSFDYILERNWFEVPQTQ